VEYRYGKRQSVREHVELWNGEIKFGEFDTANLSSGGVFIEDCQQNIGKQHCLTIKFSKNPNLSYQASRRARIVHKNRKGVGLMWTNSNNT
jgi:hypothetical protein